MLKETGSSFGVVDLTRGEMESRGTSEERDREAQEAASGMAAQFRENLGLPDGGIIDSVESVTDCERYSTTPSKAGPGALLEGPPPRPCGHGPSRSQSAIHCTLRKSNDPNPPHKPSAYLYYLLHHFTHPSMVVDISGVYHRKLELLRLHVSQFAKTAEGFGVLPLGMNDYLFGLESRDRFFGTLIGAHHGEAFSVRSR